MKIFILTITLLFSIPAFPAASLSVASKPVAEEVMVKNNHASHLSGKQLRKQQKLEKRLDRFQQKLEKRLAKMKKKGRLDASINLNVISLIVLALGGLFIFLGIVIPYIGILFIIIGALIAFVGLVMLLLLDGVRINARDGSH